MRTEFVKRLAKIGLPGLLVVMTLIGAGTSTKAQSLQSKLTATIPFDFTVGERKFSAGEYSVSRALQGSGDLVVQLSSADGHALMTQLTYTVITKSPKEDGRFVFHKYGDEYFLFEVWAAGADTGRVLIKSRAEREVQRKLRDTGAIVGMKTPEIVTITK